MQVTTNGNRNKKVRIHGIFYMLIRTNYISEYRTIYLTYLKNRFFWINPEKNKGKLVYKKVTLYSYKLENLRKDKDKLISKFANEIVAAMQDEKRYPSWFLKETLENDIVFLKKKRKKNIKKLHKQGKIQKREKKHKKREINRNFAKCKKLKRRLKKDQKKFYKDKISKQKEELLLKEMARNEYSLDIYEELLEDEQILIKNLSKDIKGTKKQIKQTKKDEKIAKKEKSKELSKIKKDHSRVLSDEMDWIPIDEYTWSNKDKKAANNEIKPSFLPLKYFNSKDYYDKIGCYIIRNRENGKCYVGQSKNIGKRIEQHFDGTKPRNYIFADDYYGSTDKDNLFEISLIGCQEYNLNSMEKKLIVKYDSKNHGYNKTAGGS